jgi:hypothetical protein
MKSYYKPNTWNAICDVCGFQYKADEMRIRWDGLFVCKEDWELDHPQKYLRVREDGMAVSGPVRQDTDPTYIQFCYIYSRNAFANLAEADCARADIVVPSYTFLNNLKNGTG